MKLTKKFIITCLILSVICSLISCQGVDSDSVNVVTFKDTTLYGYVEGIENDVITLSLGSLINMEQNIGEGGAVQPGEQGSQEAPPDLPDGETSSNGTEGAGENPPDNPDGETSSNGTEGTEENPPAKPDGESTQSGTEGTGENPPDNPDGESTQSGTEGTGETPPDKPDGETETGTEGGTIISEETSETPQLDTTLFSKSGIQAVLVITNENLIYDTNGQVISLASLETAMILQIDIDSNSTITKVQVLEATLFDGSQNNPGGNIPGGDTPGGDTPGGGTQDITYSAVNTYEENTTINGTSYSSTGTDEEAVLVQNGAEVTFNTITITRTSTDSTGGDNSSFYGVGAGLLVIDGTAYINGGTIDTDSKGGAGVFSYDAGTVYIAGTTITTQESTSGGIHVAGGGTLYAWDLTITTQGESSAAIRSDRGGGTMVVDGGTYTSNGSGSPAVYCTADIAVNDATLVANGSEGICIEGLNSLYIYNSSLKSNMQDLSQNDTTWAIIVYQSMSGDSQIGNSTLHIKDSSIDVQNGGVFYTTNTECTILLENTAITTCGDSEFFLQCTGNTNDRGWGTVGENGSTCLFTARNQTINGNIIWDKASTLDFYLLEASTIEGKIYDDETWAGSSTTGTSTLTIDETSKWIVTGDSTVTNLNNAGTIVDADGKVVTIKNANGDTLVQGTSTYVITVLGSYSTTITTTNAIASSSFETFEVAMPECLNN